MGVQSTAEAKLNRVGPRLIGFFTRALLLPELRNCLVLEDCLAAKHDVE